MPFFGGQPISFSNFFYVLAFKTTDTQMLFWSIFFKTLAIANCSLTKCNMSELLVFCEWIILLLFCYPKISDSLQKNYCFHHDLVNCSRCSWLCCFLKSDGNNSLLEKSKSLFCSQKTSDLHTKKELIPNPAEKSNTSLDVTLARDHRSSALNTTPGFM